VLVDTEAEGHRVAFNGAFARKGLAHEWSLEQYGVLLETGGGKERMDKYFSSCADQEPWARITGAAGGRIGWLQELSTARFVPLLTGKLAGSPTLQA
jgi:hypothetical protein